MAARAPTARASFGLKAATVAVLLFLHPPLTVNWFGVAWQRADIWAALSLSLRVAALTALAALVLGTLAAAAVHRSRFFGRETGSVLVILPIALPGIITGIALRGPV